MPVLWRNNNLKGKTEESSKTKEKREYPLICTTISPLIEEVTPSIDSFKAFQVFKDDSYCFFLDSGMYSERLGRYSFMGSNPFLILRSKGTVVEIIRDDKIDYLFANPFDVLEELLEEFNLPGGSHLPPFIAGEVGYFAYDLCHFLEELPSTAVDDIGIPDCYIAFYDAVVVFDHYLNKMYICSSGLPEAGSTAKTKAKERLRSIRKKLASAEKNDTYNNPTTVKATPSLLRNRVFPDFLNSNFTKEDYMAAVGKVKGYIASGDVYQVNLSQRFTAELSISPFELYGHLRKINPAPFAAYLNFDGVAVVSSSPERFLHYSSDTRVVHTRPIKGTRPRGRTPIEDNILAEELLKSEKDRAELIMIVDLERNDLGRVCEFGSVHVPELTVLEKYPTVYHLVSTIEGKLPVDRSRIDILRASFPGGSITGTPKIRAMEIIDELEPTKRSIYTGSIGYFSFTGNMDLNIAIRTFIVKDNKVYFQVGGGIVADSDPETEYYETLDKGKALIEALRLGEIKIG